MRGTLLIVLVLALTVLAFPGLASAQSGGNGSVVDVVAVRHPGLVLAERAFAVEVDLVSHASEGKEVYLFGAVFEARGKACEDGFRAFTHRVQAVVPLPPGARVTYPPQGDPAWWNIVPRDAAETGGVLRYCVFAAESEEGAHARLTYFDRYAGNVTVRMENAKPVAEITLTPRAPRALETVTFSADASDADGDPLTFHWDFGHHTADGRARAEGRNVTHAFYPNGTFLVTLRVSDPWDSVEVQERVTVRPEDAAKGDGDVPPGSSSRFPVPAPPVAVAVALAVVLNRRRPS